MRASVEVSVVLLLLFNVENFKRSFGRYILLPGVFGELRRSLISSVCVVRFGKKLADDQKLQIHD